MSLLSHLRQKNTKWKQVDESVSIQWVRENVTKNEVIFDLHTVAFFSFISAYLFVLIYFSLR